MTEPKPIKCEKCREWLVWVAPMETLSFFYWNEKSKKWKEARENDVSWKRIERKTYDLVCYNCNDDIVQNTKLS